MLHHWAIKGEFYIGIFVLCQFIEPVMFACYVASYVARLYLHCGISHSVIHGLRCANHGPVLRAGNPWIALSYCTRMSQFSPFFNNLF